MDRGLMVAIGLLCPFLFYWFAVFNHNLYFLSMQCKYTFQAKVSPCSFFVTGFAMIKMTHHINLLAHCDVLLVVGIEIELHHAYKNSHDINTLKEMIY